MKKLVIILLAALALLGVGLLAGCAPGQALGATPATIGVSLNSAQQQGIWVNGTGEVLAAPDIAILRLGIQSQEATVAEAQAKAAQAMDAVMQALAAKGVAEKDIQTQYFNIQRVTRYDRDTNQEVVIGYQVNNVVSAKIRNIDAVGATIDAVATAGGDLTRIDGISFSIDDPTAYYAEARVKAMANGKAKAEQLAELGGVTLGAPTYISESSQMPPPVPVYRMAEGAMPAPMPAIETSISAGEMKVIVSVQLVYGIE
ncbi:MAG: SIMPL domain-containing protein [Chloroflexi bacterium]|nr:SIMPL domain-containing protein [Chloroflexota bacterium]